TKPFLSGNPEPEKENVHIRAGNLFWGFTEALKDYYTPAVKEHTGIVNDYVYWFVIVLAVLFIIIGVGT
ncbi:MAG: hydrogenase, partial [Euryarchaeota archaeon CG_4_9_14_3_um_filter_38_12]